MQVYSLISSLKTYHPTLHLTPWSLDLVIRVLFQLHGEHTVLQPFRRIELIVHIAISVLPGTHFHLSQVKHLRVKCLAQGHNILTMSPKRGTPKYSSSMCSHVDPFRSRRCYLNPLCVERAETCPSVFIPGSAGYDSDRGFDITVVQAVRENMNHGTSLNIVGKE